MKSNALTRRTFMSFVSLVSCAVGARLKTKTVNFEPSAAYWISTLEAGLGTFDHRLVPSHEPRLEVVYALSAMGDCVVPKLRQLLDSDDLFVVFESLITLVQIRTPLAIEAIRMALGHRRPRVRELTIGTLCREWYGDEWLPEIGKATRDSDARVRIRALRVLGLHVTAPVRKSCSAGNTLR